jgi:hypothetical protein
LENEDDGGGTREDKELDEELVAVDTERPSPEPPALRLAWTILAIKAEQVVILKLTLQDNPT